MANINIAIKTYANKLITINMLLLCCVFCLSFKNNTNLLYLTYIVISMANFYIGCPRIQDRINVEKVAYIGVFLYSNDGILHDKILRK